MAYRRRRYTRRRTRRRAPPRRSNYKNYSYWGIVRKVARDVGRLKNLVNVEFKKIDVGPTDLATYASGHVICLNPVATGDDYNARDGRQIRMKSIELKIRATAHASSTDTTVKVALVCQKDVDGAAPAVGDIFDSQVVNSMRNLSERRDIFVMWQRIINIPLNTRRVATTHMYRKIDMKTVFNANNAGTVADIETNGLFLYLLSTEATNTPTVNYASRIRFVDN